MSRPPPARRTPPGTRADTVALARRLGRLPALLTVDVEAGFSDDPAEVAELVEQMARAGAVGVNIEDGRPDGTLATTAEHCAKVTAIKDRVPELFVNARTDTFWLEPDGISLVDETLARSAAYVAAGADGIFVPADAVYATSRKWMTGPRGVGMLAIAEPWWDRLRIRFPALHPRAYPSDLPTVRLLESREATVAGRVGLSVAVRQHVEAGPSLIRQRLPDLGRLTREVLADLPAWDSVDPAASTSAVTALRPTSGLDVATVRERLLAEHSILTTCAIAARAPRDMTGPLLRISPHVDCTEEDLHRLRSALSGLDPS